MDAKAKFYSHSKTSCAYKECYRNNGRVSILGRENYQNRKPEAGGQGWGGETEDMETDTEGKRGRESQGHSKTESKPNGNSQSW